MIAITSYIPFFFLLIRATKNNEWLADESSRRYQQKLLDLWSVKLMLEQCQRLLAR
ncbi:MAG: hypothetical protein NHB32_10545 [Fischerella sp. CENA71]|nr:hypothetical protein [Fischerella sp. CENA71]